ncbi:kininogen-1 isoform 1-T2 [Polymixia lowei]
MRRGVGLCLLGLMCLHSWVQGQDQEVVEVQPGILLFCDDPEVQTAVGKALDKFNEKVVVGHKLALYQILTASKSENGSGSEYSIQFSSRKSDCPAGGDKPWSACGYLADGGKDPSACNATVYVTETNTETTQVDCQIADPIVPGRAHCLGCPEDISENSEDLKVPLSSSISKFNSISDSTHLFSLHAVGYATRQVVAGFRYTLSFDMRKTNCSKSEHKTLHELCAADANDVELNNCNSTVDVAPWRHEAPQANIECAPGPLPPMLFTRRRPPGWSPLRTILKEVQGSQPPPTDTASAKEESSEEEVASSTAPTTDSPFHCPSKPWKQFNPVQPTPAADPAPTQAVVEGDLIDLDLLG